ncbi:PREDICTED: protein HEADING DATE 3B-like isoform X2 [Ipomoea nil]|uniref:protein HEADING DATE 3B-like isoform X2 n=1 Tax=Ipomoea nil TaxID=35883 RepID=UPI000900C1BB|nr:PREDICTED: protein HEADING DATE 3B-like isoform X2 [Ipomoea nil]
MLGILESSNSGNVVVELRKGKMRGGKEEEKKMDPMFPRLHIKNAAERGGPRAPPRNKMALSEQPAVSLPPQRLNPDLPSISMLPLPPANSPTSIPGPSSSNVGSTEKMFPPFCYPPGSSHWTGISHPYSSGIHFAAGEPSFATPRNPDVAPMASLNYQCFSVKGHLPSSECIPFQPCNLPYSSNSFSGVKLGNGGDFSVPAFHQIGKHVNCGNVQQNGEKEKDTFSSSNSYQKFRCSSEKQSKDRVTENLDMSQTRKHHASFVPSSTREKSLINVDSSSVARTSSEFQDECRVLQENKSNGDGEYEKSAKKRSASMMEDLSCSRRPNGIEFVNKCPDEQDHGSFQNEETSDASAVNSTSIVNLSPADIVRMLGQKLFWKARRTILHQQRMFVLQIFELHRLIKVQRMVARSPEILFEDNLYVSKKNLLSNNAEESPTPKTIMGDGGADKTNEKMVPVCNDTPKNPGMPALASPGAEAKSGAWCFQPPPGNQWLVPVRSPSEGLVYKPYSGPCPPPGGILAPLYGGGCKPLNLSAVGGNYLNTPYGTGIGIFSTPPVGQAYFQPYPMPVMNPSGSPSAMDLLARASSSAWEIVPSSRSQKSGIVSNGAQSLQTDRGGSDLQGSTASSPSERDALSLFPTTPATDAPPPQNQISEQRIQVIKVVPHNPNTAPESAARIFKSIQEERKQH